MGNAHGQAIKLSYFDIEGVAEMIRLALKVQGIAFEDERVDFGDWTDHLKAKAKYGQLPLLQVDDEPVLAQSGAILRMVARMVRVT
jgi:glutathione S-transferase